MMAASKGLAGTLKALLPYSDPLAAGSRKFRGKDALILAAQSGSMKCVELLAQASDAQRRDADGMTALMWAAKKGSAEMVRLLLPLSDPGAKNNKGLDCSALLEERVKREGAKAEEFRALASKLALERHVAAAREAAPAPRHGL